ncbi:SET domain family protein [Babesia bovis T2Bo]|uniref:SET domain containing protein n=1 Tax=Babesia bovis TaxID=5865 RepID=A7AQL0_BABBO|nr:SET domain family protein [Babesia bovis T2Bo]EDO06829.1 SET domain family protein [Babesia bovis T2Bo]|eukprot:XP_001610397.1 SET domain containing protein [Babesia bovis T2Bo]
MVRTYFSKQQRCSAISSILSDSKESINDDYDFGSPSSSLLCSESSVNCTPFLIPPSSCTKVNIDKVDDSVVQTPKSGYDEVPSSYERPPSVVSDSLDSQVHQEISEQEMTSPKRKYKKKRRAVTLRSRSRRSGNKEVEADIGPRSNDATHTPLATRRSTRIAHDEETISASDRDAFTHISSFVRSSRYGQYNQKFKLFWLPDTEASSLMRIPSIAQLSKARERTAELLYIVFTPGGIDILQDVSDIIGVERRPFHTPFVKLYSYSLKSMYFKVVGHVINHCSTVKFDEDAFHAKVTDENERTNRRTTRRAPVDTADLGYSFYRSYLYGVDDDQNAMRVRLSLHKITDNGLDKRDESLEVFADNNSRKQLANGLSHNRTNATNGGKFVRHTTSTTSSVDSTYDSPSVPSMDLLNFDGGVSYEDTTTKVASSPNTQRVDGRRKRAGWEYEHVVDYNNDRPMHGLSTLLWTELKSLIGTTDTTQSRLCSDSTVNCRMEAMIKRNFEVYDSRQKLLTNDVNNDLFPVLETNVSSKAMFQIGTRIVNAGDILIIRFPSHYRGHPEEDTVKIYGTDTISRFFEKFTNSREEEPVDITIAIARYCPTVFWNLVLTGDYEGSLRTLVPHLFLTRSKRRRTIVNRDNTAVNNKASVSLGKSKDTSIFDNNFVMMQNLFEKDAQIKVDLIKKARLNQRMPSWKPTRQLISKRLNDGELISIMMDENGLLLRDISVLSDAQKMVIYREHLKRGFYAPVRLDYLPPKGRAVFSACDIRKDEFVVEYKGHIITEKAAKLRELKYDASRSDKGSYVFHFQVNGKKYGIDATEENIKFGPARLINHSRKNPNVVPKAMEINGCPRLFFVAKRNIQSGEELLIDYGERDPRIIKVNPWLLE